VETRKKKKRKRDGGIRATIVPYSLIWGPPQERKGREKGREKGGEEKPYMPISCLTFLRE